MSAARFYAIVGRVSTGLSPGATPVEALARHLAQIPPDHECLDICRVALFNPPAQPEMLPLWACLGPNGAAVIRVLRSIRDATHVQIEYPSVRAFALMTTAIVGQESRASMFSLAVDLARQGPTWPNDKRHIGILGAALVRDRLPSDVLAELYADWQAAVPSAPRLLPKRS